MLLIHTNTVKIRCNRTAHLLRYKIPIIDTIKPTNTKAGKAKSINIIFVDISFSKIKLINLVDITVERQKYKIPIITPNKTNIFCSFESFIFLQIKT